MHSLRPLPVGNGLFRLLDEVAHRRFPGLLSTGQRPADHRHFPALLPGEGKPGVQLWVQRRFVIEIHRHMEQRAAWGNPQAITEALLSLSELVQGALQVTAPDIAPIDHAGRQHLVRRQTVE